MGERDWVAEARARWPGCEVEVTGDMVSVWLGQCRFCAFHRRGAWLCFTERGADPIAVIENAIRAEQAEARATLARLAVWGVE